MINAKDLNNKVLEFKNDLNKIAELGWKEFKTKDYVIEKLGKDFVWSDKTALVYKIGLPGQGEGKPVFFRAELDALNTSSGPKHVCGHSSHLSALMGAYLFLKENQIKDSVIYFVFQPSEESYPSGAEFISKNFPEIKNCQAGFAFHVMPKYKAGELADPTFAFADYFEIAVKGKATHIKYKNDSVRWRAGNKVDALLVGAELLQAINKKRHKDWIINAGIFSGGDAPNKIAGEAKFSGDVRGFDSKYSKIGKYFLEKICADIQKNYPGIKVSLYYNPSCPSFKNDIKIGSRLKKVLGVKNSFKSFGTEDFSHYPVKKGFLLIGTGRKEELHSDNFEVPDAVTLEIFENWVKISQNLDLIVG